MSPTEAIPLLIVVLLLISIGGGTVEEMAVTFEGETVADSIPDAQVVAGGTLTVPATASVDGELYVIGGTARIDGSLDGDVTVLGGTLHLSEGASVSGTVQTIAGDTTIAPGATVGQISTFEPPAPSTSPAQRILSLLLQFVVLGVAGWVLVRRSPMLLENTGAAVTDHPLISGVVGSLAAVTLLVLFVYMAFTIVLIPVAILGLIAELVIVLYGQLVFGYLIGSRLPIDDQLGATLTGIGIFVLLMEFLGAIPYVGAIVQLSLIVVGFGAVVNTYFGLQRFEPVGLPGGTT